jgi:hypothetical protein
MEFEMGGKGWNEHRASLVFTDGVLLGNLLENRFNDAPRWSSSLLMKSHRCRHRLAAQPHHRRPYLRLLPKYDRHPRKKREDPRVSWEAPLAPANMACHPDASKPQDTPMSISAHLLIPSMLALTFAISPLRAQTYEFFEERPIQYSALDPRDPMALLAEDWQEGRNLIQDTRPLGFLRELLAKLDVPEESQVLVFSKTSHQNNLISPQTPRALYFSDEIYVGYVHGGQIEVITPDPRLGPVFYLIEFPRAGGIPRAVRDSSCLSCHASARTEGVPGMLVRSVVPAADGRPILRLGTHLTTHASPLEERWGGWYVTGTHEDVLHMGNITATDADDTLDMEAGANWQTLDGKIDTSRYLRPTSDIVALMVLEHQCRMHNLLTKASMEYRRALWSARIVIPDLDEAATDTLPHRVASSAADAIVREMLFVDEALPGPFGVEGDPAFQVAFTRNAPKCPDGRSLKDFRLSGRIFMHRCSYMIHTTVFASLPNKVRDRVHARLCGILLDDAGGDENFAQIGSRERQRIAAILDANHPQWRR